MKIILLEYLLNNEEILLLTYLMHQSFVFLEVEVPIEKTML